MVSVSNAEWKILNRLWLQGPMTTMELVHSLETDTGWSKHAVISLLRRMEEKGSVNCEKQGRSKLYRPMLERKEATLAETKSALEKAFAGNVLSMVSTLVDNSSLGEEEINALIELLENAKNRKAGERG